MSKWYLATCMLKQIINFTWFMLKCLIKEMNVKAHGCRFSRTLRSPVTWYHNYNKHQPITFAFLRITFFSHVVWFFPNYSAQKDTCIQHRIIYLNLLRQLYCLFLKGHPRKCQSLQNLPVKLIFGCVFVNLKVQMAYYKLFLWSSFITRGIWIIIENMDENILYSINTLSEQFYKVQNRNKIYKKR